MDTVRAKFFVGSKTEYVDSVTVILYPVTSNDKTHENYQFFSYTPSGKVDMNIKGEAAKMFEVGKEYYLDFTPASSIESSND